MTVREAFNTILDGSFSSVIDGIHYLVADRIPDSIMSRDVKVIRPYVGSDEGYYKIILCDAKPENGNLKLTKRNGYTRTDYWFCVIPGVVNRTVYEKDGEYFIQYENRISKVDINRCHRK